MSWLNDLMQGLAGPRRRPARKRWLRGLVVGVALLLLALSAVAFWHTGVTPLDYLQVWTRPHSIDFIRGGSQSAAGDLADKFALSATASQLQTAAMGAVASAVSPYHYNYDNILLFPALPMALQLAIKRQGRPWPWRCGPRNG